MIQKKASNKTVYDPPEVVEEVVMHETLLVVAELEADSWKTRLKWAWRIITTGKIGAYVRAEALVEAPKTQGSAKS